MPTFQQCLDADPSEFVQLGTKVLSTASSIMLHTATYMETVSGLASAWEGADYNKLVGWQGRVIEFDTMNQAEMNAAAGALTTMGGTMTAMVQTLKMTKQAAESIGYKVLPAPMVILGPSQWQQVSAANVGAPAVLAAYQAGAISFTTALISQYAAIIAQDVACAATIRIAAGTGA